MTSDASAATKKTFVLVHGAWRGGWCFARVADLLRGQGHRVFTPTLTGLGERVHLADAATITLQTHIDDIVNLIRYEELSDVILVGHSYGGVVITAAADAVADRIEALVYLDAILPEAGKSVLGVNGNPDIVSAVLQGTAASGGRVVPPLPAAMLNTNAADVPLVERLGTPQPFTTFCEPVQLTGAHDAIARRTYVRATGWGGYDQLGFDAYARIESDDRWTKVDLPFGHELMLDAPDAVADVLLRA
jgi:pimeloyl-ACP methyl ester carboxylesterase